ncbi:MAG: hypothetical protein V1656_03315 [Candidatus Jorgensenbacteria bacterium]
MKRSSILIGVLLIPFTVFLLDDFFTAKVGEYVEKTRFNPSDTVKTDNRTVFVSSSDIGKNGYYEDGRWREEKVANPIGRKTPTLTCYESSEGGARCTKTFTYTWRGKRKYISFSQNNRNFWGKVEFYRGPWGTDASLPDRWKFFFSL